MFHEMAFRLHQSWFQPLYYRERGALVQGRNEVCPSSSQFQTKNIRLEKASKTCSSCYDEENQPCDSSEHSQAYQHERIEGHKIFAPFGSFHSDNSPEPSEICGNANIPNYRQNLSSSKTLSNNHRTGKKVMLHCPFYIIPSLAVQFSPI